MARRQAAATHQRGPVVTKETTIADVLEEARNTDFKDPAAVSKFLESHRARLNKDPNVRYTEDEVLNKLARESNLGPYKGFVKWAVENHRSLLLCKTDGGHTPLHLAIRRSNQEFVGLVLRYASSIHTLLGEKSDLDMTCLHLAIHHRSPFTEEIIAKALEKSGQEANGAVLAASTALAANGAGRSISGPSRPPDIFTVLSKDQQNEYDGMTPLHMAVVTEEHDAMDDNFLSQGPLAPSNVKFQGIPSKTRPGNADNTDRERDRPKDTDGPDRYLAINTRIQRTMTLNMDKAAMSPVQKGTDTPRDIPRDDLDLLRGARRFNLLEIVKRLVDANPRVLVDCKDADSNTPFQALAELQRSLQQAAFAALKTEAQREAKRHEMIENDAILRYLRTYIIDKFDRRDAMKALYKVGDERVLEFDLSGLPYSAINSEFLYGLGKVLRFEGLLKYVALPRLTVQDEEALELVNGSGGAKADDDQGGKSSSGGAGLQYMYTVFRWLKKHHVKSVLKVSVVDDAEPSHSDEAIELCLGGLDVRIWNWYKVDLCCDVIVNSAPNTRDVTLYSSGSNATLVGWSSSAGLPQLKQLKRVHVYVQEGLERKSRLDDYMTKFKKELLSQLPSVTCTWEPHKPDSNYNSVFVERGGEKATESKWMKAMEDFAEFLKSAKPNPQVRPIKIAIIDDGIDTSLDDFTDKIQVGESFFQLSELFGRRGAYYVPTGKHGTLMAQSICSVCPAVKLYIAQLEVLPGQNGQRSFTAESATEAVLWAIDQGVDIISMSWSISGRNVHDRLEEALREAARQQIIMFCASIDEGPSSVDKTYPGKTGNCIKIGASTGTGAKLSWVSESNSQFLLPGEAPHQTAAESGRWSQSQQQHPPYMGSFGSSVSTALAAGLAGVLMYCDRLLESENVNTNGVDTAPEGSAPGPIVAPNSLAVIAAPAGPGSTVGSTQPTDYLRTTHKMVEAFQVLSKGTELNKFPQMWDHLPQNTKSLVWNNKADPDGTTRTKAELGEFMKVVKR